MKITSWNINSVRIRLPLIKAFIEREQPDILCLQETKTEDGHFPCDALRQMGFTHCEFRGQKSYNGVAILSKLPLTEVHTLNHLQSDEQRHLAARLPCGTVLHNVYVPAGGDEPDPEVNRKFRDKLDYMRSLTRWSQTLQNQPTILLGDMNIAPGEHDVWSHRQLLNVVSHTPVEIEHMNQLQQSAGWIDTHRAFIPATEKLYSWWSYRNRQWPGNNRGRRLDHIWITPQLEERLLCASILPEARGWDKPSDHVPVMMELKA